MQIIKLFSIIVVSMAVMTFSTKAENSLKNGSFEEDADLNSESLMQKGFVITQWTKNWTINAATNPCEISIVEEAGAPDGKKFLRVKSSGESHVFTSDFYVANTATKITFCARGDAFHGEPNVKVIAYLYNADEKWHGKNYKSDVIKLEKNWKEFSIDIPSQQVDGLKMKIVFEFKGICDIDNVRMETQVPMNSKQ